jgi:hypothetical protein
MYRLLIFLILPFIFSCNDNNDKSVGNNKIREFKVNEIIAADSVRIPDPLNQSYFSVTVAGTVDSYKGVFDVIVRYGKNDAKGAFTMPQGANEQLIPHLEYSKEHNNYIIGFRYGDKNEFYPYFLVTATSGMIEMKYVNSYSFK